MSEFHQERNVRSITKLRKLVAELPPFCLTFFTGIENRTSPLTRMNYAYDLRIFFDFLITETSDFPLDRIRDFSLSDLERVTGTHLELFLSYLSFYTFQGKQYTDGERAKARKMSAVRSLFKYLFKKEMLSANVTDRVEMPKIHEKEIIRLDVNEVVNLLNEAESGDMLTKAQQRFHKANRLRDVAILTLFLGTGIRISELVGLNISDVDFESLSFVITRKGGNRTVLYFSDEVAEALQNYLAFRAEKYPDCRDPALFLSLQEKRISLKAVQVLVKKYSRLICPNKKITPHKLRSTYGTNLYRQTQDIYVVADVLGHKDVNTTKKHYAAISDDIRRRASTAVRLRDKEES